MIQYNTITDAHLRELVIASLTIQSQPQEKIQAMVLRISNLPEEGKIALIKALENEQEKIKQTKVSNINVAQTVKKELDENTKKIHFIKKSFDAKDRMFQEHHDRILTDIDAENILQSI